MATYIPGVQSYLPDFKPFTPDYKFLSNVLDTKTQRYQTNYKALNDLYGKVVYGNLSRKDTQEMRDQYAENLAPKLQQISGMDLSMMQNVDAAKALFKPFFEEDLIVKDLVQTKKFRNEMQYADMLKNSTVQDEREKYWQTGIQKMQYEMQDFVDADQEKALKMSVPTYTPDSDLYQMAMKFLTESELGTDVVTTISENGEWLIHRKNGDLITNEALNMVQKALKDDPLVVNAYHADAFVKSRVYADSGVEEGRFSNVDEGQNAWAREKITEVEAEIEKRQKALEEKQQAAQQKSDAWKKANKQNGLVKDSPEQKLTNESSSLAESIKDKLQEINALYDDQPQSEVDFKTTGEYNPNDTQSLLYRAYGLIMNMGMETDLQAAALSYSKKGMMSKIEANDYAVLAKRHKYDMAKVSAQHEYKKEEMRLKDIYDKENIALEAQLAAEAMGQSKLNLGGVTSTSDPNTISGSEINEDGEAVMTGDFLKGQEKAAADMQADLTSNEISFTLDMLKKTQGRTNGGSGLITIDGIGTMSEAAMQKELSILLDPNANAEQKQKVQRAFDKAYSGVGNLFDGAKAKEEALGDGSPLLFTSTNKAEEFANMQNHWMKLQEQGMAIDESVENLYKVSDRNIKKAVNSDFDLENGNEFKDLMAKAVNAGMPTLIYEDENGVTRRHTDQSYKDAYWKWIESGGSNGLSVEDVDVDGFDDTSFWSGDEHEQSWSDADDRMAYLGEGASESHRYTNTVGSGSYAPEREITTIEYNGRMKNNRFISDQQAAAFMESMYELNNFAIKGKLEATQDVTDSKGDFAAFGDIFETYDVKQAMRGINMADMSAGEIANNPTYEVLVDPLAISDEAAQQLNTLDAAIRNGDVSKIIFGEYAYNELAGYDASSSFQGPASWGTWQDSDVLVDENDDGIINYEVGRKLYDQYVMDLTKRRTTESKAQGDYPIASIKYHPYWTAEAGKLDSKLSGYTITFSDEYLKKMRDDGGLLKGVTGNKISVIIPQDKDKNVKKHGDFNFSYVATSIANSEDASFQKAVPAGGSFSITESSGGDYNMNYEVMQFNGETGQYDAAQFTKQLVNDQGQPLTQSNRRELDFYMRQYLYYLQSIGQQNIESRDAWKKSNPNGVVQDPEYKFSR